MAAWSDPGRRLACKYSVRRPVNEGARLYPGRDHAHMEGDFA
jgi:hypothetical protein